MSASEALVDIQGTRNLEKRNNLAPSQGSPADVAQALEWIMVDAQGVSGERPCTTFAKMAGIPRGCASARRRRASAS